LNKSFNPRLTQFDRPQRKHAANSQNYLGCNRRRVVTYPLQSAYGKADFVSLTLQTEAISMAMFLIAGSFRITGAQPDGDSIRLTPNDPGNGI
jgi:hypothetical protein